MNAYPSPPPPDPDWIFLIGQHFEALVAAIVSTTGTVLSGLWLTGRWSSRIEAKIESDRLASEVRHAMLIAAGEEQRKVLIDKLEQIQQNGRERHASILREMDQVRADLVVHREEKREETKQISDRIDRLISRGSDNSEDA